MHVHAHTHTATQPGVHVHAHTHKATHPQSILRQTPLLPAGRDVSQTKGEWAVLGFDLIFFILTRETNCLLTIDTATSVH